MELELKDIALWVGLAVTLTLGLVNYHGVKVTARRASFVNTITSERIRWIAKVRESVALLCSLCDTWLNHPNSIDRQDVQRRIEQVRHEIILLLNPNDEQVKKLVSLITQMPSKDRALTTEAFCALELEVVLATQAMLKREWDKVKDEALQGDLRKQRR